MTPEQQAATLATLAADERHGSAVRHLANEFATVVRAAARREMELEQAATTIGKALDDAHARVAAAESARAKALSDLHDARTPPVPESDRVVSWERECERLRELARDRATDVSELRQELDRMTKDHAQKREDYEATIERLRKERADMHRAHASLTRDNQRALATLEETREEVLDGNAVIDDLREKLGKANAQRVKAEQDTAAALRLATERLDEIRRLETANTEAAELIAGLRSQLALASCGAARKGSN